MKYRDFDLGIQLRSWLDFDIYNGFVMYNGIGDGSQKNMLRDYYYDHKFIKDNTKVISDYFLEDGSFLKIDAITLGYTLNAAKFNKYVQKIRLYVTARDVATFTKYKGYNPEVKHQRPLPRHRMALGHISAVDPVYIRRTINILISEQS